MIQEGSLAASASATGTREPVAYPSTGDAPRNSETGEPLSEAERAVWRDSELLTRIEAVLDDPDLAVPLEELD